MLAVRVDRIEKRKLFHPRDTTRIHFSIQNNYRPRQHSSTAYRNEGRHNASTIFIPLHTYADIMIYRVSPRARVLQL